MTTTTITAGAPATPAAAKPWYKVLYVQVLIAIVLGAIVGWIWPDLAKNEWIKALGDGFIKLIKMVIAPIIFCTIVVGVGSIAKAATVGKIGGLALLYFMVMSTFALAIGLVVGNIIHPGAGLDMANSNYDATDTEAKTTTEFILGIIPTTVRTVLVEHRQ